MLSIARTSGYKGLLVVGGVGILSYWVSTATYNALIRRRTAARRVRKQVMNAEAKREFAIYLKKHPMPPEEVEEIISVPYMDLVDQLKSGQRESRRVLLAYQHKAFEVDQRLNCVIEFLHPDYSEINLDGPFAGAPVSLKDNFSVKGCESYAGVTSCLKGASTSDAVLVKVMKSLGAVPFVRTNVPQAMLSILSWNPIDGNTLNPLDPTRSPGGSSSGEAALIGGGGSGCGLGADLGGSIRIPAAMCNIVGFKPSPNRLRRTNLRLRKVLEAYLAAFVEYRIILYVLRKLPNLLPALSSDEATTSCGPMAQDVATCVAVMKALCNSTLHHDSDYLTPPVPYSDDRVPTNRPLRIGYFITDGSCTPVPAAQRAVVRVKQLLKDAGHELVPWQPPVLGSEWMTIFLTALLVDGGLPLVKLLEHDEVEKAMAMGLRIYKSWRITRYLGLLLMKLFGEPEDTLIFRACLKVYDIPSLCRFVAELKSFRQTIYDHWNEASLDALICPSFGMAAPLPVGTTRGYTGMLSYAHLFNIADMPAGCLSSGIKITEKDVLPLREANSEWTKAVVQLQRDALGFPVSVQVAAAPWRDEICLHVMQEIEQLVKASETT